MGHTASPYKKCKPCATIPYAVESGTAEWDAILGGSGANYHIGAMEQLEAWQVHVEHDDIELHPLEPTRLSQVTFMFREGAGMGLCAMRPRHFSLLRSWRYLRCATSSIELSGIAGCPIIARKLGGTRQIGLITSLARLYTRTRYLDLRTVVEARLERPYFYAAPGKGAQQAVARQSVAAEIALAKQGHAVATSLFDLDKFYESITTIEAFAALIRIGIPERVALLVMHIYLGPRCILLRGFAGQLIFPSQAIIPGCTLATITVRAYMLYHADALL